MTEAEKKEFKEIIAMIKTISSWVQDDVQKGSVDPKWKTRMHFASIKDLTWQAESLLRDKKNSDLEDF